MTKILSPVSSLALLSPITARSQPWPIKTWTQHQDSFLQLKATCLWWLSPLLKCLPKKNLQAIPRIYCLFQSILENRVPISQPLWKVGTSLPEAPVSKPRWTNPCFLLDVSFSFLWFYWDPNHHSTPLSPHSPFETSSHLYINSNWVQFTLDSLPSAIVTADYNLFSSFYCLALTVTCWIQQKRCRVTSKSGS